MKSYTFLEQSILKSLKKCVSKAAEKLAEFVLAFKSILDLYIWQWVVVVLRQKFIEIDEIF